MKRAALLSTFLIVLAACGGDDDGAGTTTGPETTVAATTVTTDAPATSAAETTTTAAPATTAAAGPELGLVITSVSFGSPMVVISNLGSTPADLAGHWLCQRPAYQPLPDLEVGPGQSVAISLGGSVFLPPPGALTVDGPLSLGPITATGGEMALYSDNSFGSADSLVSYVEWGVPGHGRTGVAVEAGIWGEGEFVPTTEASSLISLTDPSAVGAAAWGAS